MNVGIQSSLVQQESWSWSLFCGH